MMQLYDQVNFKCAKVVATSYSTSFSLGIRMFDKSIRNPIYAIYSFARYADEIVDTFHNQDKEYLLDKFEADTFEAIETKLSLNPVLHAYQKIVNQYDIDINQIKAFFKSMRMDLDNSKYDPASYNEYIYGSAEVIGLMCLKVFCKGNQEQYSELEFYARSLGSAFQKINFLRDIKADFEERQRIYFPGVNFNTFNEVQKKEIEEDIKKDFDYGLKGIKILPKEAKLGVYLAYIYYVNLYKKIVKTSHSKIADKRIRVNNGRKLFLLAKSTVRMKFNLI